MTLKKIFKNTNALIAIESIILVAVIVVAIVTKAFGGVASLINSKSGDLKAKKSEVVGQNTIIGVEPCDEYTEGRLVFDDDVEEIIKNMSVEQKVAQIMMASPEVLTDLEEVTAAGNACKSAISEVPVGSVVVSSGNILNTKAAENISNLHVYSKEASGQGIFAVLDLNVDKNDYSASVLKEAGVRVALMKSSKISGEDSAEAISTTILGDAKTYSDQGIMAAVAYAPESVVGKDSTEEDLALFKEAYALVTKQANAIVVSDGRCASVTGRDNQKIMLSANSTKMLRDEMGYNGLLISSAVSGEEAVKALNAGMNILYIDKNLKETHTLLVEATKNGTISDVTLENALGRVLTAKKSYGGFRSKADADAEAAAEAAAKAQQEQQQAIQKLIQQQQSAQQQKPAASQQPTGNQQQQPATNQQQQPAASQQQKPAQNAQAAWLQQIQNNNR